jgi:nitroreductase
MFAELTKDAETTYPVIDAIGERWSPRAFSSRPVEMEKLGSLLEAARWAASSGNGQPWRFLVMTQDDPNYGPFFETLMEGNQVWAKDAPVLILGVARVVRDNGKPNGHAWYDLGQAVANLSTQATAQGLYVHQMGGFHREQAAQALNLPEGHEAVVAIALGYLGDISQLPETLQERETAPRTRKPLAELAFTGTWGEPVIGER